MWLAPGILDRRGADAPTNPAERTPAGRIALLSDSLDLPKPFGSYTLLRRLAVGGMAEVYVAKAKGIGGFEKLVAIKVIHPRFSQDEHFVRMLVEEAKIAVQLSHVNIVQTFDLGCIDDTYYIAMEFIEGVDVFRLVKCARERSLRLPIDICCYLAAEICNGLHYAHRKVDTEGRPMGIVHRDVSPQNVLVSYSGEVKLVDFGIAKAALRGAQTEVGVIKGKYYYMSPEQAWGDPVDHRSDVFSTGLLLHELLTGEMVYQEDNIPALLDRVRKAEVPSPKSRRADVPDELARIVDRAVRAEVGERYASSHDMAQDLTSFLYSGNPTFTPSRLAQLMGTLFPEELKLSSQQRKLPTQIESAGGPMFVADDSSAELPLEVMSRGEFAPSVEQSLLFDPEEDEHDSTRDDIIPYGRLSGRRGRDQATKPIDAPEPRVETSTKRIDDPGEWEEGETLLKADFQEDLQENDEGWDTSTLVDDEGGALEDVYRRYGDAAGGERPPDLPGEPTVATGPPEEAPPLVLGEVSDFTPPLRHPPLVRERRPEPSGARSGSPEPLAGGGAHEGRGSLPHQAPHPSEPPRVSPPSFGSPASGPLLSHDPFVARPVPPDLTGDHVALGRPEPKRWILPIGLASLGVLLLGGVGAWIAGRPPPTTLDIMTIPEGASVIVDGRRLEQRTPLTLRALEPGRSVRLEIQRAGYEPTNDEVQLAEGLNRKVFLLNRVRATLHVDTAPRGAHVWIDGVLRGSAPVDIMGLSIGQTLQVRVTAPGYGVVERTLVIDDADRNPSIALELPSAQGVRD